jgi:putative ATPase
MIFRFTALTTNDLQILLDRAVADRERGIADCNVNLQSDARDFLAGIANGDARIALNALELAAMTTQPNPDTGLREITLEIISDCVQQRPLLYDRDGQIHYDTISAFIKSMRGSDPDAAIYYLARMLSAGEDPKFIARRLMVHAAEDIGNADPMALLVATAAAQSVEMVGLPEARIPMAQATIYIASAPKSNASCAAINQAMADVQSFNNMDVPAHLRDSSHSRAKQILGDGVGYKYPHDYPDGFVEQDYLPENLINRCYYHPSGQGKESEILIRLRKLRPYRYGDKPDQDE